MRNATTTNQPVRSASGRARGVAERLRALREERGAQAAEYAMLGGVSAAACGGLVALFSKTNILETLVNVVLDTLGKFITSWF